MELAPYSCFTIQSTAGSPGGEGYVHIPYASIDKNVVITAWALDGRGVDFTNHFEFVLVPVADAEHTFYVVNRRSGLALQVRPSARGPVGEVIQTRPGEGRVDDPSDDEVAARYAQFVFEEVGDGAFTISNLQTGTYLGIEKGVTDNGVPIVAVPAMGETPTEAITTWRLTLVKSMLGRLPSPAVTAGPRVPQLKNLQTDLPDATETRLRQLDLLPFFMISDPIYPLHLQVEASPYYTLRLLTMWRRVYDRQLDGIVERETTQSTETGLSTLDAHSVASTFSWSVEAEAKVGYKGWGVSASMQVSSKLAGETSRAAQSSEERHQTQRFTETILYPAVGYPYRLVKWHPIDRYELRRKDGSLVAAWDSVRPEEEIIDVYPRKPQRVTRLMSAAEADQAKRAEERKALAGVN